MPALRGFIRDAGVFYHVEATFSLGYKKVSLKKKEYCKFQNGPFYDIMALENYAKWFDHGPFKGKMRQKELFLWNISIFL